MLERAKAHVRLNGFDDAAEVSFADADVNAYLRQCLKDGLTFDAIVLDPPKFAPTAAHAERAARAYKDINRLALKLLVLARDREQAVRLGRAGAQGVRERFGVDRMAEATLQLYASLARPSSQSSPAVTQRTAG